MLKTLHDQLYSHKFKLYNMVCNICYKHVIYACIEQIPKCYTAYAICYITYIIQHHHYYTEISVILQWLCYLTKKNYVTMVMLFNKKNMADPNLPYYIADPNLPNGTLQLKLRGLNSTCSFQV